MANRTLQIKLTSPEETRAVGMALGRALPADAICLLSGELGSGKTTLVKAVCEGLGVAPEDVISPTYTLVNIYPGPPQVFHVDFFRIQRSETLLEMDPDDWINPAGITLIEWPDKALRLLEGRETLSLRLGAATGRPRQRELTVTGGSPRFDAVFEALKLPVAGK